MAVMHEIAGSLENIWRHYINAVCCDITSDDTAGLLCIIVKYFGTLLLHTMQLYHFLMFRDTAVTQ